jgi:tRNA dimethylallyltransferase
MVQSMEKHIEKIYNKLIGEKCLIVIAGPTASGKTVLSLELSKHLPVEIISADSRQLYKYMDIGTAKPSKEELATVKHHFIDYLNPDEDYNAGKFGDEAELTVNDNIASGNNPLVVGGSGLYIKSLCEGLFSQEDSEEIKSVRDMLNRMLEEKGKEYLFDELKKVDPETAEIYSDKNPRRVMRALEYYYTIGESILKSRKQNKTKRNFNFKYFGINFERQRLYDRINLRTELMWKQGLADETRKILNMGYSPELNSLNTVGYKETIAYLNGKLTEQEAIEEIKKNTRRYAKRQITWFKSVEGIQWLDTEKHENGKVAPEEILEKLL